VKIPFNVYDTFGYLVSGFLVLVAVDYSINGARILGGPAPTLYLTTLFVIAAYLVGHLVSHLAEYLLQSRLTRRGLGVSEELLLSTEKPTHLARHLVPGYFIALPPDTVSQVIQKAAAEGVTSRGRALFLFCWARVKSDPEVAGRLATFLNLYGFARNACFALLIAGALVAVRFLGWPVNGSWPWWALWAAAAIVVGAGMYYRYLKFYRLYGAEVFVSYLAKTDK